MLFLHLTMNPDLPQPLSNPNDELSQVIQHVLVGEIRQGECFGVHFFDTEQHRVIEETRPANPKGVWEALIEVRHPRTNSWVRKRKPSTLFPQHWSKEILCSKLQFAFQHRIRVTSYKTQGITDCGIVVVFIKQQQQLTSCFPLYEV